MAMAMPIAMVMAAPMDMATAMAASVAMPVATEMARAMAIAAAGERWAGDPEHVSLATSGWPASDSF